MAKPLQKPNRSINRKTSLLLYTRAGGRCEFDGCNRYLLEHKVTGTSGNFAEQAHIYAFREGAARGLEEGRPKNVHNISNLMLLCKECHHLVDKVSPEKYPVDVLKKFKKDHEERIFHLTGISKNRDTIPLVLKTLVHDSHVDISDEEMQIAVAPDYLKIRDKVEIDLTSVPDQASLAFWQTCMSTIDQKISYLYARQYEPKRCLKISVFAIAPIPLLIYLGTKLSNKMPVELYQRHRQPETWSWKSDSPRTEYKTNCIQKVANSDIVSLLLNLSGKNTINDMSHDLKDNSSVYEITISNKDINPLFLNTRDDLQGFREEYIRAIAEIRQSNPSLKILHLFPAVPAPIAISIGRERLPKVDPVLKVYDRDSRNNGFIFTLEIR